MSEPVLILIAIVVVAIVALVVVLAVVAVARKEVSKNIRIGDDTINISSVSRPGSIAGDTKGSGAQAVAIKKSIKLHLSLLTFVPPSFSIVAVIIWWLSDSLAAISNILIWAAWTLLIPAIYGELHRPGAVVNRIVLILDGVFFILLSVTILAPRFMTVEVVMGMSLAVIGFAINARGHKASN